MRKLRSIIVAGGVLAAGAIIPVGAANATPVATHASAVKVVKYKNCAAMQKVYPHGVGASKKVKDKTSGKRVATFTVNAKVYAANKGLDRDKDGIACEKR